MKPVSSWETSVGIDRCRPAPEVHSSTSLKEGVWDGMRLGSRRPQMLLNTLSGISTGKKQLLICKNTLLNQLCRSAVAAVGTRLS